jgi:hypothetical protein
MPRSEGKPKIKNKTTNNNTHTQQPEKDTQIAVLGGHLVLDLWRSFVF